MKKREKKVKNSITSRLWKWVLSFSENPNP